MQVSVYAAPLGTQGTDAGPRQPAYRAWADALLVQLTSLPNPALSNAVAVRCTGRIARLQSEPPFVEPLIVDPSVCSIAIASSELPLFTPYGWSEGLTDYLADNGIDRDVVEEHLPVCAAPLWPTRTAALPEVLREMRSDLLLLVGRYFVDDVRQYLDSWRPLDLTSLDADVQREVVVPESPLEAPGSSTFDPW